MGELVYVPKKMAVMEGTGTSARPKQIIGVVESKPLGLSNAERANVYSLASALPFAIARISREDVRAAMDGIERALEAARPRNRAATTLR